MQSFKRFHAIKILTRILEQTQQTLCIRRYSFIGTPISEQTKRDQPIALKIKMTCVNNERLSTNHNIRPANFDTSSVVCSAKCIRSTAISLLTHVHINASFFFLIICILHINFVRYHSIGAEMSKNFRKNTTAAPFSKLYPETICQCHRLM